MRRTLRIVVVAAIGVFPMVELSAQVANVDAALPPGVRSGERVRFVPRELRPILRVIEAEGRRHAEATELAQIVHSESRALQIDPLYALALIKIESGFRADAVSRHGATGLLQVRSRAARSVGAVGRDAGGAPVRAVDLDDPRTNVAIGLRYLRQLERQFDDETMALAAYNIGPTRVRRHLARGTEVSRAYAKRVLATYQALAAAPPSAAVCARDAD